METMPTDLLQPPVSVILAALAFGLVALADLSKATVGCSLLSTSHDQVSRRSPCPLPVAGASQSFAGFVQQGSEKGQDKSASCGACKTQSPGHDACLPEQSWSLFSQTHTRTTCILCHLKTTQRNRMCSFRPAELLTSRRLRTSAQRPPKRSSRTCTAQTSKKDGPARVPLE